MPRPMLPPRTPFEINLRKRMQSAGITTYKELAEKSEVSAAALRYICAGRNQPSMDTLTALAKALKIKPGDLIV